MERDAGSAKSARVRDAWTTYACSQTEQLLSSSGRDTAEVISTKRRAFADHLDAIRAAESLLRQRMNTLAPIYRLADETLAHIVSLVCAGRCPNPTSPTNLMLVSTRWCSVIRTYPGVWSHPSLPVDERAVGALLECVKAAPLYLDWRLVGTYVPLLRENLNLASWMSKCRTLAIHATTRRLRVALAALGDKSEALLLESMSITVDRSRRHESDPEMIPPFWPSELFSNNTPHLRKLRLIDVGYFRWTNSLLCPTLAYLEITCSDKAYVFPRGQPTDDDIRAGGCSYNDLLDTLERLTGLRTLILTRCTTTSLLFGAASSGRQVRLDRLCHFHVWDTPQACSVLCQTLAWPKTASILLRFPWSEYHADKAETVASFMRSIRIQKEHYTELDITVAHQEDTRVPHRSLTFQFHYGKSSWGRMRVEGLIYRPRRYGNMSNYTAPLWYRDPLITMASSLPLRGILILRVRVDPTAAVLSKSMWLDAFPRALWITELFVDNAQVPALASALGSQDFYERNAMTRLFPRLAYVVLSKVELRDILLLDRAIRRRAPQPQMILGRFIIDAEVVKRKPSHPAVVFVKPDGSRVPVSTTSIKKDSWGTSREWFDVRKALKAQSERRRVRNTDKDARVSIYEHLYALGKHTCFRHKHALQSAAVSG